MNKKVLTLAVLASLSLGFASCKSKKGEAPRIDNTGGNNGGGQNNGGNNQNNGNADVTPPIVVPQDNADGNNTLKPNESPVNAAVVIKANVGDEVTIKSDSPLTLTGVEKVAGKDHTYKVTQAAGFGIDGAPAGLTVNASNATAINLDKDLPSLKNLAIEASSNLKELSLNGVKQLETFAISGANSTQALDLSGFSKLKDFAIGPRLTAAQMTSLEAMRTAFNSAPAVNTSFSKIVLPSSLISLVLFRVQAPLEGLDNMPALKTVFFHTPRAQVLGDLKFANSPLLEQVGLAYHEGNGPYQRLEIKNKPNFKALQIFSANVGTLHIDGGALSSLSFRTYSIGKVELLNQNERVTSYVLRNSAVKNVEVSSSPRVTSDALVAIFQNANLARRADNNKGKLKVDASVATDAVRQAAAAKNWDVE